MNMAITNIKIVRVVVFLAAGLILAACEKQNNPETYSIGGDFTLTDQNGQSFTLSKNLKKVNLLFFGYTLCPDVCPTSLNKIKKAISGLGDKQKDVRIFFVTVDPERDNPEKLKKYLSFFELDSVGLTGKKEDIDIAVKAFGATYEKTDSGSKAGYLIDHSSFIYLIDESGKVRYLFRHKDTAENMTSMMKLMIR
jgi:protein SCO1